MFIADMNETEEPCYGYIYSTNCTICSQTTSNHTYDLHIAYGILIGSVFTIILITLASILAKIRSARRLHRIDAIAYGLNDLV